MDGDAVGPPPAGVLNAARGGYFREHEEHYAYLPLAWVGDFVFTLGAGVLLRFAINIPERQETVLHDLREVVVASAAQNAGMPATTAVDGATVRLTPSPAAHGTMTFVVTMTDVADRSRTQL